MIKKKIILGVSASIAAYKSCELVRMLIGAGFDVSVIMTENAQHLVGPLTFETLTGNTVLTDSFVRETRQMGHISIRENAGLFLVAPATANIIGKFASGIADDLLSTTYLSVDCPVLIAPAMNPFMWNHRAVKRNVETLKEWGNHFVGPSSGKVVCGDSGEGKLSPVKEIFDAAEKLIK